MTRFITSLFGLLVLWSLSCGVKAACGFASNLAGEIGNAISFGNVSVQRDTPVGIVIATAVTGAYNGGNNIAGCNESWIYRWEMSQWRTQSAIGNRIYATNLPGVGIRLTNIGSRKQLPYDQRVPPNTSVYIGAGMKAELIKTGAITPGTLTPGVLARASIDSRFYFANVTLGGTNTVTTTACTILTPELYVLLGDHEKSNFYGPGAYTEWKDFWIELECDKDARIYVQVDAEQDPTNVPGVMKLDSAPGDIAATGVGVQLYFAPDDRAVRFGQRRIYYISPGGGTETVQFKARYYQTAPRVSAGVASATATFTLTYR